VPLSSDSIDVPITRSLGQVQKGVADTMAGIDALGLTLADREDDGDTLDEGDLLAEGDEAI
jgi:hypothetical protein